MRNWKYESGEQVFASAKLMAVERNIGHGIDAVENQIDFLPLRKCLGN